MNHITSTDYHMHVVETASSLLGGGGFRVHTRAREEITIRYRTLKHIVSFRVRVLEKPEK